MRDAIAPPYNPHCRHQCQMSCRSAENTHSFREIVVFQPGVDAAQSVEILFMVVLMDPSGSEAHSRFHGQTGAQEIGACKIKIQNVEGNFPLGLGR